MVMGDNSPRVTIDRWLADAAGERGNGCKSTDVDTLHEHLTEALEKIDDIEGEVQRVENKADERISELEAEAECSYTVDDRKGGRSCDDCHACRLSDSKRQIDCGADDAQRDAGVCKSATDLGIDRCCACAAHRAEKRLEDECADRDTEIARLTRERDEARDERNTARKAAAEFGHADSVAAEAKGCRDCGRADRETSDEPCPRRDMPGGCCDECFVKAALVSVTRSEEAKRETLLREIEGLNNQIQIVTEERNAAIVKADSRPLPAVKVRATRRDMESGSLFDRIPVAAEPDRTADRPLGDKWAAPNKKHGPATVRPCGCGGKGAHRAACKDATPRKGRNVKKYPLTPAKVTP